MSGILSIDGSDVLVDGDTVDFGAPITSAFNSQFAIVAPLQMVAAGNVSQSFATAVTTEHATSKLSQAVLIAVVKFNPPVFKPQRYRLPCSNWCQPYLVVRKEIAL